MNKSILSLTVAGVLTLGLVGCGGGGDSSTGTTPPPVSTPDPVPTPDPVVVTTAEIEVAADFDFRIDSDMTLSITEVPQSAGIVNVYHAYEHHDETNDIYYPDINSRVLSFYPASTSSVDIQINDNWEYLVVEFVPTEAQGVQMFKKLDLTDDSTISFSFSD
jgi:hypothetical protein